MATPKNYSVIKAFAILKAFQDAEGGLSGVELSRRANLPLASGYRLIQTMEDIGVITRGRRGQYRPGMLLLSISGAVRFVDLLRDAGEPILKELAKSLSLSTHLAVLENGKVVCVGNYSSTAAPGRHRATWRAPEIEKILLAGPDGTKIETFTRIGCALPIEMRCVAVSVQDSHGRIIAAISSSDAIYRMPPAREALVKRALLDAAARLQDVLYVDGCPARGSSCPLTSGWTETVSNRPGARLRAAAQPG